MRLFGTALLILHASPLLVAGMEPITPTPELAPALPKDSHNGAFNSTKSDFGDHLDDFDGSTLEKRKACSGNRLQTDVCMGNFIYKASSRHNCYRKNGHCCAKNKNRDYGIAITNESQKGEDCGYCFSGGCKAEKP